MNIYLRILKKRKFSGILIFLLKKGRFTAFWGEMVQEKQRCLIVLIEM